MSGCQGCAFRGQSTAVEDTYVGVRFREETNLTLCLTRGRLSTPGDRAAHDRQLSNESSGKLFCQEQSSRLGLEMKVTRVDFSLDGRSATFYYTADGRVDFRQLVRDLARRFSTRVKMVQVGARDEAKLLGGVGVCGQTLCCSTWLKDFRPISIQMAKRQSLSLNPSKISGQCGRLLCCLAYEDDLYRNKKQESSLRVLD